MARTYLPVLLLVGFVAVNAVLIIGLSALLVRRRVTPEKASAYESGIPALGDARERFSVKFYMIPWGVYYRELSCAVPLVSGACPAGQVSAFGFLEMLVFMVILLIGFVYVWKRGALQWD